MFKERTTLTDEEIKTIEEKISYEFKNKGLLIQAFTRRSYGYEHGVQDNEMLEFIGDRALDYIVTRDRLLWCEIKENDKADGIYKERIDFGETDWEVGYGDDAKRRSPEEILTDSKINITSGYNLSKCMKELDLSKYLILNKADITNKVYENDDVLEDLIEAIIGAIAIDCNWDFDTLYESITDIILKRSTLVYHGGKITLIDEEIAGLTEYVQEWFQKNLKRLPNYEYEKLPRGGFDCVLKVNELGSDAVISNFGRSKKEAKNKCAEVFFKTYLSQHLKINKNIRGDYPFSLRKLDIIDFNNLSIDTAINIIQEAQQKNKIPEIKYLYDCLYDKNGNPLWRCTIQFKGIDGVHERYFEPYVSSKKSAKKNTALSFTNALYHAVLARDGGLKGYSMPFDYIYETTEFIYSEKHDINNGICVEREFVDGEKSDSAYLDILNTIKTEKEEELL